MKPGDFGWVDADPIFSTIPREVSDRDAYQGYMHIGGPMRIEGETAEIIDAAVAHEGDLVVIVCRTYVEVRRVMHMVAAHVEGGVVRDKATTVVRPDGRRVLLLVASEGWRDRLRGLEVAEVWEDFG